MSLINDMLKDLEKRQQQPPPIPMITTSLFTAEKQIRRLPLYIGIGCTLILGSSLLLMTSIEKIDSPLPIPHLQVSPTSTTKQANHTAWLQPSKITGVTLQEKDDLTEVTFLLDHAVLYRLIDHAADSQLSLILDNTQLQAALPDLNAMQSAIRLMNTQLIGKDTRIDFILQPGATVHAVTLNRQHPAAELQVTIRSPHTIKVEAPLAPAKTVKAQATISSLEQAYQSALAAATDGAYETAIPALSSLLKNHPQFKEARISLAAMLIDQGDTDKANLILDKGLQLNPDSIPMIELKARLLTTNGKIKEAITLMQSATPAMTDYPEYHAFIAGLYERSNEDAMAIRIYQRLLAINSNNGNWWFGLGVSLDKTGQTTVAMDAYHRAMTDPSLDAYAAAYSQRRLHLLQETNHAEE